MAIAVHALDAVPGSFRDRTSRVFVSGDRIVRVLRADAARDVEALLQASFFRNGILEKKIIDTEITSVPPSLRSEGWERSLTHSKLPIISYPFEWSFSMLKDAALLTLSLLEAALKEGWALKDATPYNVQFVGAKPIFIDVGSFEKLPAGGVWQGYRQFCELFLFPLLLASYKGLPTQVILRGNLEGISSKEFVKLLSLRDLLRPGVFTHGWLQSKLQGGLSNTNKSIGADLSKAGFHKELILANVRKLQKLVASLSFDQGKTTWSDYSDKCPSYTESEREEKRTFIKDALSGRSFTLAWDIGCNTGEYSRIISEQVKSVIGLDADSGAIERMYEALKKEQNQEITPLVVDVTKPIAMGWRGKERELFENRSSPDLIIALAVIHHITIGSHVPLNEFLDLLVTKNSALIIEFVDREDPMVKKLLLNKRESYPEYTRENFERLLTERFKTVSKKELSSGQRVLYFVQR